MALGYLVDQLTHTHTHTHVHTHTHTYTRTHTHTHTHIPPPRNTHRPFFNDDGTGVFDRSRPWRACLRLDGLVVRLVEEYRGEMKREREWEA